MWPVLLVVLMVVVIVTTDVLFLRGHFWPRLLVNTTLVVMFGAAYYGFIR